MMPALVVAAAALGSSSSSSQAKPASETKDTKEAPQEEKKKTTLLRRDLTRHLAKECPLERITCPYPGCSLRLLRSDLATHENEPKVMVAHLRGMRDAWAELDAKKPLVVAPVDKTPLPTLHTGYFCYTNKQWQSKKGLEGIKRGDLFEAASGGGYWFPACRNSRNETDGAWSVRFLGSCFGNGRIGHDSLQRYVAIESRDLAMRVRPLMIRRDLGLPQLDRMAAVGMTEGWTCCWATDRDTMTCDPVEDVDTSDGKRVDGDLQKAVLRIFKDETDDRFAFTGTSIVHVEHRLRALGHNCSSITLRRIVETLSEEGHLYSTIDEDHFRTTTGT